MQDQHTSGSNLPQASVGRIQLNGGNFFTSSASIWDSGAKIEGRKKKTARKHIPTGFASPSRGDQVDRQAAAFPREQQSSGPSLPPSSGGAVPNPLSANVFSQPLPPPIVEVPAALPPLPQQQQEQLRVRIADTPVLVASTGHDTSAVVMQHFQSSDLHTVMQRHDSSSTAPSSAPLAVRGRAQAPPPPPPCYAPNPILRSPWEPNPIVAAASSSAVGVRGLAAPATPPSALESSHLEGGDEEAAIERLVSGEWEKDLTDEADAEIAALFAAPPPPEQDVPSQAEGGRVKATPPDPVFAPNVSAALQLAQFLPPTAQVSASIGESQQQQDNRLTTTSSPTGKQGPPFAGARGSCAKKAGVTTTAAGKKKPTKNTRTSSRVATVPSSSPQKRGGEVKVLDPKTKEPTTPKDYFNAMISSRGYSTKVHSSSDCGYHSKPSPLQIASFGTAVVRAVERNDAPTLSKLLRSGLSRNPCNAFSEGTLARSIKRGHYEAFRAQLDAGAEVHVVDDFGRTPLHHAAWSAASSFEIVEAILDIEPAMIRIADKRGETPLDYLTARNAGGWVDFLEMRVDKYWPERGEGWSEFDEAPRALTACAGDSVPDPDEALPADLARMVSMGGVDPDSLAASPAVVAAAGTGSASTSLPVDDRADRPVIRQQQPTVPPPSATLAPPPIHKRKSDGLRDGAIPVQAQLVAAKKLRKRNVAEKKVVVSRCA